MYILIASIAAATAYLQVDEKWWKGLTFAFALPVVVLIGAFLLPPEISPGPRDPASGIIIAAMIGAMSVALGAVTALALRSRNMTAGGISGSAFAVTYVFLFVLRFVF